MEELQSTEILDREILEDARKKALRILKDAEVTIQAQDSQWKKKTDDAVFELNKKYDEQKKNETDRMTAKLPVDKLKAKIEKIEISLKNALESWYATINRKQIQTLLSKEISKLLDTCKEDFSSDKIKIEYSGLDQKEAVEILNNIPHSSLLTSNSSLPISNSSLNTNETYPSIIIESNNVRITASIENIIETILHERRVELVETLVGKDFMEGA